MNNGRNLNGDGRPPRAFVDLSTTLSSFGRPAIGIVRLEHEIARRLLREPRIVAIPCVFSAGSVYALDRADALRLIEGPPTADGLTARLHEAARERFMLEAAVPVAEGPTAAARDVADPRIPPHVVQLTPLRMPVRSGLRRLARIVIAGMPASIREDVRLVLIHGREIARKTLRRQLPEGSMSGAAEQLAALERSASAEELALISAADRHAEIGKTREAISARRFEIGWPETGEIVWTCGSYGAVVPLRFIAEARRRFGFSCLAICHDQIRGEVPEWNPQRPWELHYDCVAADLLDAADRILCISAAVRSRLLAYSANRGLIAPDAIVVTPGYEPPVATAESALPGKLVGRRFALAVGPFAVRSNLGTLVRTWEALADRPDFDLDLVLVGGAVECEEEAMRTVVASRLFGRRIIWFDECPDDVLVYLIERADGLLCPGRTEASFAEEAAAEALAAETPILASYAARLPDAASGLVMLVDPGNESAWRDAVLDLAATTTRRLPPVHRPAWDAAIAEIVALILKIAKA